MPADPSAPIASKRRHVPAAAFMAVAAGLSVFIALLPRTGNQPPPPTVAEFAPQAAHEIKSSSQDQTSQLGSGPRGGACADAPECDANGKPKKQPEIKVPQVRQCYRFPDGSELQSPDPQSPPCIPYWDGNNGGATYQGVTANEIVVAVPTYAFENGDHVVAMAQFFNKHFQFYKRKLTFVQYSARNGLNKQPDPALEKADAADVDEKFKAFASLSTGGRFGSEHIYYDELARRGVLSVAHRIGTLTTEAYLDRWAPYRWAVQPGMDQVQAHMAALLCNVLKAKPPAYAGPGITGGVRKFGLVYERAGDGTVPDLTDFRHRIAACGIDLDGADYEDVENGDPTRNGSNTVLKLIQKNVTSVVCFCEATDLRGSIMQNASAQQYRPEWIVSSYIDADVDNSFSAGNAPTDQAGHVIGLSFRNKWLPREYMPWFWAIKDTNPNLDVAASESYDLAARYSSLLLLASGIQEAGPHLTPQTFEAGLQKTLFPNPGAQGPPYFQAWVGFPNGSHTFMHDSTMYWFSPNDRGTFDPANLGAVCYVDRGKRTFVGAWHKQEPAFYSGSCHS